jgi:hypothetical protein
MVSVISLSFGWRQEGEESTGKSPLLIDGSIVITKDIISIPATEFIITGWPNT